MELKKLMLNFPKSGRVEWIGIRSERRKDLHTCEQAHLSVEAGLVGDHYNGKNKERQVTLVQAEHIDAVAKMLERPSVDPGLLRRNIVVSGINLLALKDQYFRVGDAVLLFTGYCHPCSRMERNLGAGGYSAMRGHGGITAKVIEAGSVKIGDAVDWQEA
ncbi:MOSC domain-containing protein [Marinilongibacter aquaticus]|uniref:MOSC domain-containing protein n=1 Tax=Marinilongibacter aquaticus TaxID=2975157 RepID=UPI0021BDD07E|nr:MOSC domain-containing protein [Marinilongibacter aquaticus]UBM58856.1 MOSC domain-containing protein [Marinilongibacter aquaticus]